VAAFQYVFVDWVVLLAGMSLFEGRALQARAAVAARFGARFSLARAILIGLSVGACQALTGEAPLCEEAGCIVAPADPLEAQGQRLGLTVPAVLRQAGEIGASPAASAPAKASRPKPGKLTLSEATRHALKTNPDVGQVVAQLDEAIAAVKEAKAPLLPQLETRLAGGYGIGGTFQDVPKTDYFRQKDLYGSGRGDVLVTARQLLYDFGATRDDIARANARQDSRALRVAAMVEDVSQRVADLYSRILEGRELLGLAEENISDLGGIAELIRQNQANGNATAADVRRVEARLNDAETLRADQNFELLNTIEKFRRSTGLEVAALAPSPSFMSMVPKDSETALAVVAQASPRIQANNASIHSARAEAAAVRNGSMPKFTLDGEISNKQFAGLKIYNEMDARSMVTFSYALADGGMKSAQLEQAMARVTGEEMRAAGDRQDIELEVRQAYISLATARTKAEGINAGLKATSEARSLYQEQFKGGKRSLLELLDVQAAYVTARRNAITNVFEQQRASYVILRSMGRLTRTVLGWRT
jgi:adhesin transport system outer membrane protein